MQQLKPITQSIGVVALHKSGMYSAPPIYVQAETVESAIALVARDKLSMLVNRFPHRWMLSPVGIVKGRKTISLGTKRKKK